MRQQKLAELIEQLAVTGEIAGGVLLLHLAEQCACAFKRIAAGGETGCARYGRRRADEQALGIRKGTRPLDLAIIGQELAQHDAGQRRDLGLLRLDIDRLDDDELMIGERLYDEIAANDLRAVLIPQRQIAGKSAVGVDP